MPAFAAEVEVVERIAGSAAADGLRAPFVLGGRDELTVLLANAGLESASITTQRGKAHFPSVRSILEADIKGFLPLGGIQLTDDQIQEIFSEGEQALSPYVTPNGTLVFDSSVQIITATKSGVSIN